MQDVRNYNTLHEKWFNATKQEISNMTLEEAKTIIIESFEENIANAGEDWAAREWYARAMELVLPLLKA